MKEVHRLAWLGVKLEDSPEWGVMIRHYFESSIVVDVKSKHHIDPRLMEIKETVLKKSIATLSQKENGVLRHQGILCVQDASGLKETT